MTRIRLIGALAALVLIPFGTSLARGAPHPGRWQVLGSAARMPSFYVPSGLATAPDGTLFVADTGNNRILHLSQQGSLLGQWATQLMPPNMNYFHLGPAMGYNYLPAATIAAGGRGQLYVLSAQQPLREFSSTGKLLRSWQSSGVAVAADRAGNAYIADGQAGTVSKQSPAGRVLAAWGGFVPDGTHRASPVGIAVASSGEIYVDLRIIVPPDPSTCGRGCFDSYAFYMARLSPIGRIEKIWKWAACSDFDPGCSASLPVLTVGRQGVLVTEPVHANHVLRFSRDGALLGTWGGDGSSPGRFDGILGMVLDAGGAVYVADAENGRIQKLGIDGHALAQWGGGTAPGQFNCPQSVTVAPDGSVFVLDANNNRVQGFDRAGALRYRWTIPNPGSRYPGFTPCRGSNAIAAGKGGRLYLIQSADPYHVAVTDRNGHLLARFGYGYFSLAALAVSPAGNVVVTGRWSGSEPTPEQARTHLLEFSPTGDILAQWQPAVDKPLYSAIGAVTVDWRGIITVATVAAYTANRIIRLSPSFDVLATWSGVATPQGLAADSRGNVFVADTGEDIAPGSTRRQAVYRISAGGSRLAEWSTRGSKWGQIHEPGSVALDPNGRWLYVADTGNERVQRLWLGT